MSHIQTILDAKGNCVISQAGIALERADELMELYDGSSGEPPEGYHELMERVQDLFTRMCDGTAITQGEINGGLTFASVIADMDEMLEN